MQKNKLLKIITGLAIVLCMLFLFMKLFLASHYKAEQGGGEICSVSTDCKQSRPIDREAIEREQRRENARNDSLLKVQEYNELPFISQQDIAYIQPVIQQWLDHCKIDLSQMRFAQLDTACFSRPPSTFHHLEFTREEDSPSRIEMSYSPDKQRYIDLGYRYKTLNGKHYEDLEQYDDSQPVYLVDRRLKRNISLFYHGLSGSSSAAYWKDNDVFIVINNEFLELNQYVIYVFDISKQTKKRYKLLIDEPRLDAYSAVYLNERGIIREE